MLNAHCDFHGNQPLLATTSHPGTLSDYQITVANPGKSHAESSLRFSWQSATPSYHFPPENLELVKAPCEVTLAMAASSAGLAKNIRYMILNLMAILESLGSKARGPGLKKGGQQIISS